MTAFCIQPLTQTYSESLLRYRSRLFAIKPFAVTTMGITIVESTSDMAIISWAKFSYLLNLSSSVKKFSQ